MFFIIIFIYHGSSATSGSVMLIDDKSRFEQFIKIDSKNTGVALILRSVSISSNFSHAAKDSSPNSISSTPNAVIFLSLCSQKKHHFQFFQVFHLIPILQ